MPCWRCERNSATNDATAWYICQRCIDAEREPTARVLPFYASDAGEREADESLVHLTDEDPGDSA